MTKHCLVLLASTMCQKPSKNKS